MNCQVGSRRCATWDEIDEAPQLKRMREEKSQESVPVQTPATQQQVAQPPPPTATPAVDEKPKFYISAPIQGFTVNNAGGCRYLFF